MARSMCREGNLKRVKDGNSAGTGASIGSWERSIRYIWILSRLLSNPQCVEPQGRAQSNLAPPEQRAEVGHQNFVLRRGCRARRRFPKPLRIFDLDDLHAWSWPQCGRMETDKSRCCAVLRAVHLPDASGFAHSGAWINAVKHVPSKRPTWSQQKGSAIGEASPFCRMTDLKKYALSAGSLGRRRRYDCPLGRWQLGSDWARNTHRADGVV